MADDEKETETRDEGPAKGESAGDPPAEKEAPPLKEREGSQGSAEPEGKEDGATGAETSGAAKTTVRPLSPEATADAAARRATEEALAEPETSFTQAIRVRVRRWRHERWGNPSGWAAIAAFLVVFTGLYFFLGTHLVYQINQDRLNFDQQHNINLSERSLELRQKPLEPGESVTESLWRGFPHYTDGVVNPLWPWVASFFHHPDHARFFVEGKWFNLVITGMFLVILGLVCTRTFSPLGATIVVLLAGLGAFLPRATYFQPEPLFYIWFLASWVCCLSLLRRNGLWLYGVLGVSLGLAYLAKTSIQPLVLVFVGVTTLRYAFEWVRVKRGKPADDRWSLQNHFIGLAVLATAFLVVAGPRLTYAQRYYGDAFHSYPSYWMWMDGFEEAARFMVEYPDAESLATLSDEEKPSAGNYLRENETDVVIARLREGVERKARGFLVPSEIKQNQARDKPWKQILPHRGWYLLWLVIIMLVMAALRFSVRNESEAGLRPIRLESAGWMILFALGCFVVYTLAYGFYTPIGKGDRFMLSLYPPLVLTTVWIAERFRRQISRTSRKRSANLLYAAAQTVLLCAVTLRVIEIVRTPLFRG